MDDWVVGTKVCHVHDRERGWGIIREVYSPGYYEVIWEHTSSIWVNGGPRKTHFGSHQHYDLYIINDYYEYIDNKKDRLNG